MRKREKKQGLFPSMTLGVMGSAGGWIAPEVMRRAYQLGEEIGKRGYVLITGACPGIPHEAVKGAKAAGGIVVGISPGLNFKQHVEEYLSPTRGYDAIIYTGSGLMGREIENIRSCDAVIFVGGRSGTLGEFAIAYDEAKVIGVLENTGGITEHIEMIISFVHKDTGSIVAYSPDPTELLDKLEDIYRQKLLPQYLSILEGRNPDGVMEQRET